MFICIVDGIDVVVIVIVVADADVVAVASAFITDCNRSGQHRRLLANELSKLAACLSSQHGFYLLLSI